MGSINDFKLLNSKCESYFTILETELSRGISLKKDSDKARFGFYLYILENVTNTKEFPELLDAIIDTDFCATVFGKADNDLGMDAVYIDEENKVINLFNFKFREKFEKDSKHQQNTVLISAKFMNALLDDDTKHLTGRVKDKAEEILNKLNSNDVWKMRLYVVSNENNSLDIRDGIIDQMQRIYDLEVIPLSLDDISDFMSLRPQPICATLVLNTESVLSYTESELATTKSYILKMSVADLIRITCNNTQYRLQYGMEDYSVLNSIALESNTLFDNVRGYLGATKYNQNIFRTLKDEPNRFFMYNNGLTIVTKNIEAIAINGNKRMKIDLDDIQVVNGGQTLRTLHEFNKEDKSNLENYLTESEILVRIFKTGSDDRLISNIAEYTNSQNSISPIDLKSIAYEQIQIEQFFDTHQVIYARKNGDTGAPGKNYTHKLSMEKFAQILFSIQGNPDKASNQKQRLFDKYYKEIFGDGIFDLHESFNIYNNYLSAKSVYETSQYEGTDQKIFYILYLQTRINKPLTKLVDLLENNLVTFRQEESISSARKLIQLGFKEHLNQNLKI